MDLAIDWETGKYSARSILKNSDHNILQTLVHRVSTTTHGTVFLYLRPSLRLRKKEKNDMKNLMTIRTP